MQRLQRSAVEQLMDGRPDSTLEGALEVFEVFASGSLTDEIYILDDVAGKRIAIAPASLKEKYRRGGGDGNYMVLHPNGGGRGLVWFARIPPLRGPHMPSPQ